MSESFEGENYSGIPEQKEKINDRRKSIEVDGKTWNYLEHGNPNGIPILNIHGWLGSSAEGNEGLAGALAGESQKSPGLQKLAENSPADAAAFEQGIEALKDKYHILTPELPGFGSTEALEGKVTLDQLADSLVDFQQAINIDKSMVFGSSMGGILAIKMAARHPESVKNIIIQGTMTRPEDMDRTAYVLAQIATWGPIPDVLDKLNLSKKLFATIVQGSKDFKIADEPTQKRIMDATFQADSQTAVNTLKEIGKDVSGDIDRVQCPVVVLDGVSGDLVPIMKSHEVAKRFYPGQNLEEKVPQKIVFLPIGGSAGEQGHNLVNTFPEGVARWIDYTNDKFSEPSQMS